MVSSSSTHRPIRLVVLFVDGGETDDLGLLMAEKMREGDLGFVCLLCGQSARHKRNIRRHMKEKHMPPVQYECPSCQEIFTNRGFSMHVVKYHPTWKGIDLKSFRIKVEHGQ